jgi:hypothetical protein
MPNNLHKRIELAANIAVIVVAVLLVGLIAKRFLFVPKPPVASAKSPSDDIKRGTKISLPDVDWTKKETHLVLVLQKGCHFCSESAPFYQRLATASRNRTDLELVAALPQSLSEAKGYLDELNVPIADIRQSSLGNLGVRGTPTLLLVDRAGSITDFWVGKLPPDKESEVLKRLGIKCDGPEPCV